MALAMAVWTERNCVLHIVESAKGKHHFVMHFKIRRPIGSSGERRLRFTVLAEPVCALQDFFYDVLITSERFDDNKYLLRHGI